MFNKLYENIKKYIKENYKSIIIMLLLFIILSYPVPYYIYNGGGTLNVSDRVKVNNNEEKQQFFMCYVGQMKANILTLGMSYVFPNIDSQKIVDENIDEESDKIINDILLKESEANSVINAYNKASKNISINDEELYITYLYEESDTNLNIGDMLISINDSSINSFEDIKISINNFNFNDEIILEVKDSNDKIKERKAKVVDIDGEKKLGIGITTVYKYKTSDDVNIEFKGNETGPSGGFMMSLTIYDKLMNLNLSKNNKICGTGTITKDGKIGEIGGVKYKLAGAVQDDCDVFLIPSGDNYNEAIREKEKNDYDIDIYEVKNFNDTIRYLKSIA